MPSHVQVRVDITSDDHVLWLNDLEEDPEYSRCSLACQTLWPADSLCSWP